MKEQKQKIEDHDSGKNKMSGTDYWNLKSGQKKIKNLLFMFKSNMSDEVSNNTYWKMESILHLDLYFLTTRFFLFRHRITLSVRA